MQKIYIVDFGSQTTHLIGRRIKDLGAESKIISPKHALKQIKDNPAGIIFSGGPSSVYETVAPKIDKKILNTGIPILGICYGWQLMAYLFNGKVEPQKREYGPAKLTVKNFEDLFFGFSSESRVFESHGDTVTKIPKNFKVLASTDSVKYAGVKHISKNIYGVQFHPEVDHSDEGVLLLKNFVTRICNAGLKPRKIETRELINELRQRIGNKKVIGAFSGGTDSAVAGTLVARAIGKQFIPVYVDSGLMREGTLERIKNDFPKILEVNIKIVRAKAEFLKKLKGVSDPEKKRKVIGKLYIDIFEREMKKHKNVEFLLQGTTYADFIHSQGNKQSALIKSHHNVGGLPKNMKMKLLEPIRYLYTDQVRNLGLKLGLPKRIVYQQPFPGPGHGVRIVGAITKKRLAQQVQADAIVIEELKKGGWYKKVFQCWSIMTGANSTGIKGDGRFYGEVVALRIVTTKDRMTADWVHVPYNILAKISTRIVNEVPDVSRVVYDITTKPPATMEWE